VIATSPEATASLAWTGWRSACSITLDVRRYHHNQLTDPEIRRPDSLVALLGGGMGESVTPIGSVSRGVVWCGASLSAGRSSSPRTVSPRRDLNDAIHGELAARVARRAELGRRRSSSNDRTRPESIAAGRAARRARPRAAYSG
jgi:hypothetical protein